MKIEMVGIGIECYQTLTHKLGHSQKIGLKHLLSLNQTLKHPEFPNAKRGLEGLMVSHEHLKEKNTCGVLIGGLAESVWNKWRSKEGLYSHKDVDVMVLSDEFKLSEDFEKGIDWWLPYDGEITIKADGVSDFQIRQRWWKNCNNVPLSFKIEKQYGFEPGLYITSPDFIANIREAEALANVDYGKVEIDDDVLEAFESKVKKQMGTRVPKYIEDEFSGYILENNYEEYAYKVHSMSVEGFDNETMRAIRRYEEE